MYRRPSKKKDILRRVITYAIMTISVIVLVTGLVLMLLGYRLDTVNGQLEQGALLQFETVPSGASVVIDDKALSAKTPSKSTVRAGVHTIVMQRDGYETWQKTLDIKAGTLTWLNYARLVPKERKPVAVTEYSQLYASLATTDGKSIIVQQSPSAANFQVIDIRSDEVKAVDLTIPATIYSEATTAGVAHTFTISQWDEGDRYVLLRHDYGDKKEWLVLDTRDANATKNVTELLDIDISSAVFSGNSGNILYALTAGDIRKLDLSGATISRTLVTQVTNFNVFDTNVITYVGSNPTNPSERVVGLYREGDTAPHVLRVATSPTTIPLHIATGRYFNQDYIVISEGAEVTILRGSYPSSASDDTDTLVDFATFTFAANVDRVSFSPAGDYVLAQAGPYFTAYDIEHQRQTNYTTEIDEGVIVAPVQWLDNDHIWTDYSDQLILREFDGANTTTINQSVTGQAVALTQNGRWLYSVGKTDSGYQLQRVRMVLP